MKSGKSGTGRLSAWQRSVIFVVLALLAGGGAGWYFWLGPGSAANRAGADDPTQAYTTAVKRGDLSIQAAGSGRLVGYQAVDLSFSVSGVVSELNVQAGDMVTAGQVLARLGGTQALESALAAAQVQALTAQKTLTDMRQGGGLALAQALSDRLAAQAAYDAALEHSQRISLPRCSQEINTRYQAALDRVTANLENIHAETAFSDVYTAAKQEYDTALANYTYCSGYTDAEKSSALSALEVARTALEAAGEHYDTLEPGAGINPGALAMADANLKKAQAQVAKAEEQLAGTTLTAPVDGKVTSIAAGEGALAGTGTFLTIASDDRAALEISVDESDVLKLVEGAPVKVTFDALPDQSFIGRVVQVNPQMTTSGQYRVAKGLVELDEAAVKTVRALPLGLSASVTIVNQEAKGALLAPTIALKDLGDGAWGVMVQGKDGTLRLQTVTVGIRGSDYAEITGGLNEGDLVSTGSVRFIAAGAGTSSSSLKNAENLGKPPQGGPVEIIVAP